MVTPDIARRVISDAARLVKRGEIVVFGSASLAFWLKDAPRSRDVDHVERILAELPIDQARLEALAAESPYRARAGEDPAAEAAFEIHFREIVGKVGV